MLVLNSFIHKYPSRTVLCTHTFLLLLCECYSHVGVLCFRILLRHRHQPDRGPEVHLHPPYGVSEGPGDVHVPDAAELGEGADARLQTRLRQHHSGRLHHWMPVCTDRGRPEPEAAETVIVTLDRLMCRSSESQHGAHTGKPLSTWIVHLRALPGSEMYISVLTQLEKSF